MPEDEKPVQASNVEQESAAPKTLVEQVASQFSNWLKDTNPEVHSRVETAMESVAQLAEVGLSGVKSATDMLNEFAHDLTGVESFQIIPKASMALEVDIHCKKEQEIVVRQQVAPFIELYALHLGRRIHFEALINKSNKGLQLDIHNGMNFKIMAPLIGMQTVQVKGSGTLYRDDGGELMLSVTSTVPGIETPVTVAMPVKHIIAPAQAHLKSKLMGKEKDSL